LQVLVPDTVVSPQEPSFEVPESTVDTGQDLCCPLGFTLGTQSVAITEAGERGIPLPSVGQDEGTCLDMGFDE
jgi:hypothetical protein